MRPNRTCRARLFARRGHGQARASCPHTAGSVMQRRKAGSSAQHTCSQARGVLRRRRCDARRIHVRAGLERRGRAPGAPAARGGGGAGGGQARRAAAHAAQQPGGARRALAGCRTASMGCVGCACWPRLRPKAARRRVYGSCRPHPTLLLHMPFRDRAVRASSGTLL